MATESRYIQLMDTTLRDGEQTQGVSFTPAEKVNIAKALLQWLRVDRIEVASARVSQGEKEAVASINEWALQEGFAGRVEVLGFVDHTRSVDWIVETGGNVINLLTKGSEKHCREQLGKTLEQHTQDILQTIGYALQKGLKVNVYLEDWSNGYQNSPDYVFGLMDNLKDAGISHFMLPDTLGVMSPDEVYASIGDMCSRYPALLFDFHPHNDYGLATANVMAAVRAGVSSVHCTVNCLGERAGNASLAEVAVVLRDKMAMQLAIDETHIVRISQMVENFSGKRVAANAPIIGTDVFTQTAGIHADGDHKGGLYKTRLSPERFSRTRSYALGKMSGKASLKKNLELLEVELSEENQKKVLARIVQLGDSKQTITTDDLPFIIADVLESKSYEHIRLLNCSITSGLYLESTASIRVEVNGEKHSVSGSGNGGFDAFIDAMDRVLKLHDYTLPALADYEVRIPKGGHTDALTECVITWDCGNELRKTRGVHANQVFAGVMATLKIINMQLHELRSNQG
ncbi:alpha-isopropylmalate synthase regulatory domain-containing protein [Methylomicrobium sp. Wu6]|uniref:alpha-isopropylmalate synthase regulatory domain-containing protein n=1 Tax=Methylomicrobium sp. Wu6 TaxID=3107928 RepID=UPI002DD63D19|nr:alpha-isopropylmalate synthase regulatory domain-containing protein [Methylomicrobium sp. Wu6]MEC4747490.1 alpha-isopropylmalate synthase regulatory domain-containing protein [Methylomicrobium sp. Wu6]